MLDIITIGSSLVDTFVKSSELTVKETEDGTILSQIKGDKVSVDEYQIHTGGGASNTAVGFARMGFTTAVVSELGQDILSNLIIADFTNEHVSTDFLIQEKKEQTGGSVILLGSDGTRTVLVHRGAASCLDPGDVALGAFSDTKWVHLSSIGGNLDTLKTVFAMRKDAMSLSWNPGQSEIELIKSGALSFTPKMCQIFFVNNKEWQELESVHTVLLGAIETVIVTHGEKGGKVFSQGNWSDFESHHKDTVVDVTGAGDSFIVGCVSALLLDSSIELACKWGAKNAASVVSAIGAKPGLLSKEQLEMMP